jgi:hypothetical protein
LKRILRIAPLLLVLGGLAACGDPAPHVEAPPAEETFPEAPWRAPALPVAEIPSVYVSQWERAQNRASCALLAPAALGAEGASPRAAQFSGGWAVAYDLPEIRSAFGIAGTGVEAEGPSYAEWPHWRSWADGSRAGYGPEGGTGPSQLAYLEVAGQTCLYNVWSRLGVDHLEYLIEQLRFVVLDAR